MSENVNAKNTDLNQLKLIKKEERLSKRNIRNSQRRIRLDDELRTEEDQEIVSIITEREKTRPFVEKIMDTILNYNHDPLNQLYSHFEINSSAKNAKRLLVSKILEQNGDFENTDEFRRSNILIKTISVNKNDKIENPMSFKNFTFKDIIEESWEKSQTRMMFKATHFLFVIFKELENGIAVLYDCVLWNMPKPVLNNQVKTTWSHTKELIEKGKIVKEVISNNKYSTNLPNQSFNNVCFVSSHAASNADTYPLPVIDKVSKLDAYTKQSFWLTKLYLSEIIGIVDENHVFIYDELAVFDEDGEFDIKKGTDQTTLDEFLRMLDIKDDLIQSEIDYSFEFESDEIDDDEYDDLDI